MLVVRSGPVIKDRLQLCRQPSLWGQPSIDVLGLDLDDGAVMSSCRNLGGGVVGDSGKGQQVPITVRRLIPQAGDDHVLFWLGPELEHHVLG